MNCKRGFSSIKYLVFILLSLIVAFFVLNFAGVFSMNSLPIIIKEVEPIRKPFCLLFMGLVLLAFVIVCLIHKKNQRR